MDIQVTWETEKRLNIRVVFGGQWTWDDFTKAYQECDLLAREVDYPVGVILELCGRPPEDFVAQVIDTFAAEESQLHTVVVIHAQDFLVLTLDEMPAGTPPHNRLIACQQDTFIQHSAAPSSIPLTEATLPLKRTS
jgi:hypothetical protein